VTLNASPEAQFCGALGAALHAMDHVLAERRPSVEVGAQLAAWVDE
jgi:hypothetical protein